MHSSFSRTATLVALALALLAPGAGYAEGSASPERPVVIDPQPDWSSKWARKVCAFARSLAAYDPSFQNGAESICAFVLGTE